MQLQFTVSPAAPASVRRWCWQATFPTHHPTVPFSCHSDQTFLKTHTSKVSSPCLPIYLSIFYPSAPLFSLLAHPSVNLLFICPSTHLSIHPFISPFVLPSIHLSVYLSIYPSVQPFIVHPSIHPSAHPFIHMSIHSFIHLSICPYIICSSN